MIRSMEHNRVVALAGRRAFPEYVRRRGPGQNRACPTAACFGSVRPRVRRCLGLAERGSVEKPSGLEY